MQKETVPELAPTYDWGRLSVWLQRIRESEGFRWSDLAERADLGYSTLMALVHRGKAVRPNPSAETIAKLAFALDLDVGYVMEKAGLGQSGSRWSNFTRAELDELQTGLRVRGVIARERGVHMSEALERLAKELDAHRGAGR